MKEHTHTYIHTHTHTHKHTQTHTHTHTHTHRNTCIHMYASQARSMKEHYAQWRLSVINSCCWVKLSPSYELSVQSQESSEECNHKSQSKSAYKGFLCLSHTLLASLFFRRQLSRRCNTCIPCACPNMSIIIPVFMRIVGLKCSCSRYKKYVCIIVNYHYSENRSFCQASISYQ